ncbi:MAG TPA: carboxymuconolactone decarboxylase family protein [Bryobacteraceae bacterium]|nr:carboxymuconolactone decarboxylase family protein [Bryobacteraceae bacterium]
MQEPLPESVLAFEKKHPAIWQAFARLGEVCHEAGPLDQKTRRLVKLAMAVALRHEGAVHSATRNALRSEITPEEIEHVVILAITTIGWPSARAAMTWIDDEVAGRNANR